MNDTLSEMKKTLTLPVIAAPMFLVSNPDTVIAGCKAGIISTFPSLNARTTEILDNWMAEITEDLDEVQENGGTVAPWAVNLIVHRTNKRYTEDFKLIEKYHVPIVITSLGDPTEAIKMVHGYGGLVFSDVSSVYHAKKAAKAGVDGLILVCAGAGGHGGTIHPYAFIQEVREFWDGILILAGSISSGKEILASEILGADFAYMGTRFIATAESSAGDDYKNMLIKSHLEDIIYTDAFSGVNANYLIPSIVKAGLDPEKLKKKESIDFSKTSSEVKAWKNIWSAGQGVGRTKRIQTVEEVVKELHQEYLEAKTGITKSAVTPKL